MRKKSIPWSDIKSIEFFYLDQYKKQRIVINLEKKKIVFRAEVLNDGWGSFCELGTGYGNEISYFV